ncbi:MAG: hypothetical protein IJO73_09130 [Clostridia bacterium]|nr:hypothetical protein [Clostridia bacterium]
MICKNCANIFSDDLTVCPECDTPISGTEKKEKDINEIVSLALGEFEDISSYSDEKAEDEFSVPVYAAESTEPQPEPEKPEEKERPQPVQQRERQKMKKMSRKERGAFNFIISLMVVAFVGIGALVGVSLGTDVFEKDEDTVMAMALSGLSSSETAELEDYLSKISVIAYNGFDREEDVIVDVMEFLRPYDGGGIYSRFYGTPDLTVNEADPNGRFANENGDYSFYALKAKRVDKILKSFGFDVNHNVNEKDFYYYDGKYYFANLSDYSFSQSVSVSVSSSKRIQDGSYYVECSFYDQSSDKADSSYLKAYIILDKNEKAGEDDIPWSLIRISHEPVFDATGFMIKDESGKNELSYIIESQTIQAVTEDGVVYAEYNVEYPYFKGSSEGEKAVNSMFAELINNYTLQTETADKDYKRFIRKGGDKNELPYVTHAVARVTYNRNGYISIVEGLSQYSPQPAKEVTDTTVPAGTAGATEAAEQFITLPERTVEGYIIDVETGNFLSAKEIIDTQYHLVYEVIYRIYEGYDYESLLKGEDAALGIPEDTDEIGKTFYESASALSENGFIFCSVHPKGYTETVVIPYSTKNFFNSDFSKLIKGE